MPCNYMFEPTYRPIAFYLKQQPATPIDTYTIEFATLFLLWRIRGFVAVGVGDESHRQITAFQTAFKLLPFQSGGALITDNSFHFNKEF